MPEEKPGTEETQETEAKETETEEQTSEKNKGGDETTETDEGEEGTEEEEEIESEEDFEPEVRKRDKKDYIIERLQKKNEKLQAKTKEGEGEDDEEDDDENPDSQSVQEIVRKELAPVLEKQREAEDKAEVEGFIADNPQFKPYKDKMLKYCSHPAYEQLPIENIAAIAARKDLMKLGASEAAKADQEAKQGQMGGGSARGKTGQEENVWGMSKDKFEQSKREKLEQARNNE